MSLPVAKKLKRCAGRSLLTNTQINDLPDDILICVVSFLTLKEAGRASVLSKRWKHLWVYNSILDFESREIIYDLKLGTKSLEVEQPKYFHWIDHVVSLHKAPTIDEFRVRFDVGLEVNESSCNRVDNWLRFAIEKGVKRLELDFSMFRGGGRPLRHTFPNLYCNSLTSLELGCVNITGEILASILCSCPALEYLSVKHSETLEELKVDGPTLNLKSLTVFRCSKIKQLEIYAPNLVSICYFGPKINVQFKCTPKLAQVSIGYDYALDLSHSFSDLSRYISQIEVLVISIYYSLWSRPISNDIQFSRLKKLDLTLVPDYSEDILFLISLLKACPLLGHLKLQCDFVEQESMGRKKLAKPEAFRHYHLKIVEVVGFAGYRMDMAIINFLIENAISLDRIIVDPRDINLIGSPWEFELTREKRRARMRAKQLRTNLKPATKLEIL